MKVYHHTDRSSFDNIIRVGRVLPLLCREAYHPALSSAEDGQVFKRALWAMPEPMPEKWMRFEGEKGLDWRELQQHMYRGRQPTIMEIEVGHDADIWIADWAERLKDKEFEGMNFPDSPRYHASMRRYNMETDTSTTAQESPDNLH